MTTGDAGAGKGRETLIECCAPKKKEHKKTRFRTQVILCLFKFKKFKFKLEIIFVQFFVSFLKCENTKELKNKKRK